MLGGGFQRRDTARQSRNREKEKPIHEFTRNYAKEFGANFVWVRGSL
jgi:hypothetical protein